MSWASTTTDGIGRRLAGYRRPPPAAGSTALRPHATVRPSRFREPGERLAGQWGGGFEMWEYEPDEVPKKKHHWDQPRAGFITVGKVIVGKCPSTMTMETARELLNSGVEWSPKGWRHNYPKRIYTVSEGVLYRAALTNSGRSYHGFPEHPSGFPKGNQALRDRILELAKERNCETELRRWMKW